MYTRNDNEPASLEDPLVGLVPSKMYDIISCDDAFGDGHSVAQTASHFDEIAILKTPH